MKFSVKLNLLAFRRDIIPGISRNLREFVFTFRAKLAGLYGGVKTGRVYPRPRPLSGTYQASAAGEPPAIASGRMFRSLRAEFPTPLSAVITIDTPYAARLEYGDGRIAARPFARPALKLAREQFQSLRGGFR